MPGSRNIAYPQLKGAPSAKELETVYTPNFIELVWAEKRTREPGPRVGLLVLLKTFQRLGYFVLLTEVPVPILEHVARCAGYDAVAKALFRYGASSARRILEQCEAHRTTAGRNYLPFLSRYYSHQRAALFRFLESVQLVSTSSDMSITKCRRVPACSQEKQAGAAIHSRCGHRRAAYRSLIRKRPLAAACSAGYEPGRGANACFQTLVRAVRHHSGDAG